MYSASPTEQEMNKALPTVRCVGFSLGSNQGDRLSVLESVCDYLADVFGTLRLSQVYETAPVGCPPGSPDYLNACVEVETSMPAAEVLELCLRIEQELGRSRSGVYGEPRTCDIDVLYCGQEICQTERLTLPHPRAHEREFVLRPLADIAPNMVLPGQEKTVSALLSRYTENAAVRPFSL